LTKPVYSGRRRVQAQQIELVIVGPQASRDVVWRRGQPAGIDESVEDENEPKSSSQAAGPVAADGNSWVPDSSGKAKSKLVSDNDQT